MNHDEKRALIERYLNAYNTFDIDGMLAVNDLFKAEGYKHLTGEQIHKELPEVLLLDEVPNCRTKIIF